MAEDRRPSDDLLESGIVAGLFAGAVMLIAELGGMLALGAPVTSPLRLDASVVLGPLALSTTYPLLSALIVGGGVHFILAALFGAIFVGLLGWSRRLDAAPGRLLAGGAAFGVLLWALNFLILGSLVFPQFSNVGQLWNGLIAHGIFFGLALGAFVARKRRFRGG